LKPFDSRGNFHPTVKEGEVAKLAVRGAGVTIFSGGFALALQIVVTVILARLLTPADFGVVTMVTTFSLLLVNFGLNGFTEAVIQREEINQFLVSNLFWITAGVGLVITIGFGAAGSLLARFYHAPLVARVAVGISPTIFLTSISVLHLALLKRAMCFFEVSVNDIISRIVSSVISIFFAWAGWGYWALVIGAVTQPLFQSFGAWLLCPWIPRLPRRVEGTAPMVRFAINVYGRFTLNYFSRNTDNLLVGWRFGSNALGFYKKAYDLFALSAGQLTAPLTNVAVAALSRFDPYSKEYRRHLLSALSMTALVGMALSAEFTLVGRDLIRLLLGPGWTTSGRIFTFFAPGIGIMLIYYVHSWIHLSIGKADRWLRWGAIEITVTCLFFLLALPWGPEGVATAWTASFWILTFPALWYAGRPIGLGLAPVIEAIWKYVAASLLAGFVAAGVIRLFPSLPVVPSVIWILARVVAISSLFTVLYLGAVVLLHQGLAPLRQATRLLREMLVLRDVSRPALRPTITADIPILSVSQEARSKPLVSILIPAFNAEEWIADTIGSALAQTWERKEIIVVDDSSTDLTLGIARQFESKGVRVVTQKNQGAAAARNKAFSLSQGDYIQWLDADDLLAPDKIARQMEALEPCPNKRLLLSSRFGRFMYRPYRAKFSPTSLWCDLPPAEWLLRKLQENAYMQTGTWLVSRELTEAAGPWDTTLLADDDGEYFCRVLLQSDGIRFVPEATLYYRAPWVGTLSYLGRSERKLEAHWRSMRLHIRYLCSLEDSARVRHACLLYLQRLFIYFYPEMPDIVKQMQQTAAELGGHLERPRLPWKYLWVEKLFGWGPAKRVELLVPKMKWLFFKSLEKALFRIERRVLPAAAVNQRGALEVSAPKPRQADE
jgi:PST family polysaccharide transporter